MHAWKPLSPTSGKRFAPSAKAPDRQMAEIQQFIFDLYGDEDEYDENSRNRAKPELNPCGFETPRPVKLTSEP